MARSEAQKQADKRYEEKRKGTRARAGTTVVYPESAAENGQEVLRDELIECLISPLHDKDKNPNDDTTKKAHGHVVLSFKNPVSQEHAEETFNKINGVGCQKVKDFAQLARYLCHLDHPNKYQYKIEDVVSIGAIDYRSLIMSGADEDEILDEIFSFIRTNYITSFAEFIDLVREKKPEGRHLVYRQFCALISRYIKSCEGEYRDNPKKR